MALISKIISSKKNIFLLVFFIGFAQEAYLQENKIYFEVDYNTFDHKKLKDFQRNLSDDFQPVRIKTVDDFSSNLGFTIGYELTNINAALYFSYTTTGGKLSYGDYSGEIRILQPLIGYSYGVVYSVFLAKNKFKNRLRISFKTINTFSTFEINSYYRLEDSVVKDDFKFSSFDFGLGSFLQYEQPVSIFKLRLKLGYDQVFGGKLKFSENNEAYLQDARGSTVRTNWSGLRTGLGISYSF